MTEPKSAPAEGGAAPAEGRSRGYLASTVKHGSIYALGTVLAKGVGFVMLPVYTVVLTTADYGILEILALSTDILGMLVGLGVRQAVLRYYYQYETEAERNGVISTASLLLIGVFSAVGLLGLAFSTQLTDVLLGPDQSDHYVRLAVIAFALGALGDIPGVWLQAQQKSQLFVSSNLARTVLSLSLNIVLVVWLRIGVAGIFWSNIVSSIVVGGFMLTVMLRATGVRFASQRARELIAFGAPLMVWQLGSFVLHFSDRYFLRVSRTLADVGIYALSYKLAMLLGTFVIGPFRDIWIAKSLEIDKREGSAGTPIIAGILRQYNLVLVVLGLMIALFATDVIHLMMGRQFASADRAVPVLMLAMIFFGYRQVSQTGALIASRPGLIATSSTIAAGAAILLNLLLIPTWGAMGAAIATAGAFALEFVVMRSLSLRVHPLRVPLGQLAAPMLLATVTWLAADLAARAVSDGAPWSPAAMAVRIVAAIAFIGALAATGILHAEERHALLRILRDPRELMRALRKA